MFSVSYGMDYGWLQYKRIYTWEQRFIYVQIRAPTAQKQEGIQFQILQKPKDFELTMLWTEL